AAGGVGEVAVVVIVDSQTFGVGKRPVTGDVIGVVGHCGPWMSVGRDVPIAVQVVEQDELVGQLVVVRRDLLAAHHEALVAVAAGNVAENLVVSAVFVDDVQDVLDGRAFPRLRGNGRLAGAGRGAQQFVGVGAVAVDLIGVFLELLLVGEVDDR